MTTTETTASADAPDAPASPGARAVPGWLAQIPYALVLTGVASGLLIIGSAHFRRGSVLIAGSILLGALFRLVLPEARLGLLAVRDRWLDVVILLGLGLGLATLAISLPAPETEHFFLLGGTALAFGLIALLMRRRR
ncbi:MAG: DUF3017 domain-containing protein [Streptosporangiales bacterium]|nr:DUF3017 domain-containing protein [Streptosporangiales bacterium]